MKKPLVYNMTSCALMAALMCALCPLSVPIGPIPVSLGILVILLTVYLLGTWRALVSYTVYLLLGAVGMPVFSGYLVGFWLMILVSGLVMEACKRRLLPTATGMVLGVAVDYAVGTAWFVFQTQSTVAHALEVCVYPFIPFDLAKIAVTLLLGSLVYKGLQKAKLL